MKKCVAVLIVAVFISGCGQTGPPSTDTSSEAFDSLAEKKRFLKHYVTFDRPYEKLDFVIFYRNNSGGIIPGPSDWDVRIVAQVPQASIADWLLNAAPMEPPGENWPATVPTAMDCSGISQWFQSGKSAIGVDRVRSIIVYRNKSMGQ